MSRSYHLHKDGATISHRDTGEVRALWRRSWVQDPEDRNPDDGGRFAITVVGRAQVAS